MRVSSGRDPGTGTFRFVHRTVTGSKRVAQKAADQLAAEVHRGLQPAMRGMVADLVETWMLRLETQGRAADMRSTSLMQTIEHYGQDRSLSDRSCPPGERQRVPNLASATAALSADIRLASLTGAQ